MKKIIIITLILFFSFIEVKAWVEVDLGKPLIRFPKENDYVLQGFTNADNKLFTVFIDNTQSSPKIKIFNLDNGKIIKEFKTYSLGHANDATYNKNTNKIYVLHSDGKNVIHAFDANTYERDTFSLPVPARSITYIDNLDIYAVRTIATGFYLKNDFSLKSKAPFIVGMNISTDIGRQGWTYYDGLLFYSTWSWIRNGGDGSNVIIVYNVSGERVDEIITPTDIGELEDVAFYKNKMILGFNTYDDYIEFYSIDIPKLNRIPLENKENNDTNLEEKDITPNNIMTHKIIYAIIMGTTVVVLLAIFIKRRCS